MQIELLPSTKICDSIYVGDQYAAKDLQTIVMNHITHIINCNAQIVSNHFESHGIKYLMYGWKGADNQVIFDKSDKCLNEIYEFIEQARENGESCLIHTHRGNNIPFTLLAGYFIKKYHWSLYKTLEFLDSRLQKTELKGNYFRQLKILESRFLEKNIILSVDWTDKPENSEQLILRNTYLNSIKSEDNQDPYEQQIQTKVKKKQTNKNNSVKWNDLLTIHEQGNDDNSNNQTPILKKNEEKNKLQQKLERLQKIKIAQIKNLEEIKNKLDVNILSKETKDHQKPSKDRKIIHLYSNSDPPVSEKGNPIGKLKIQDQYVKFVETPLVQQKKKITKSTKMSQQRRMLKSELSEQNKKYQDIKKPVVILFKDETQKQIKNIRKSLNKSDQSEKNSKGNSKRKVAHEKKIRFQTEFNEQQYLQTDEFHRNTFKKLVLDKTKDNPKNEIQHKQNIQKKATVEKLKARFQTESHIIKADKPIKPEPVNIKTEISNFNNEESISIVQKKKSVQKQSQPKFINNFIEDTASKKSSLSSNKHKSVRGFSPGIPKSSNHKKVNISIDKLKGSIKLKTQTPSSAIVSQNSLSLKEATNIINNIFLNSNFKPKWKF